MGLRINTNIAAIKAQRALKESTHNQGKVLEKLSSGLRINRSGDDAAGLAISEKLKANIRSLVQARRNANDGISLIQTAEGGLTEVSNILIRLRELSVQSASDTIGNEERRYTNLEFQALKDEVSRIADVTSFNGVPLLNGSLDSPIEIQVGVGNNKINDRLQYRVSEQTATAENLGISGLDVLTKGEAQGGLVTLDEAIQKVSGQRANLGALQNRLGTTISNLSVQRENLIAAKSRISDADFAAQSSELTKQSILNQAGVSVLLQANSSQRNALKLIS